MARFLDPCLRVVREWLPVPDVEARHVGPDVEADVAIDPAADTHATIALGPTTLTALAVRGETRNPKRPYQAFVRVVSLPWEVRPGTAEVRGGAGRFRLEVRRAQKQHVGERVIRETEEAVSAARKDHP